MGKGKAPSSQTVTQTNLPEYAQPYFERLMERTEAQSLAPYQPYQGQRLAPQGPDIQAAYDITRGVAQSGIAGLPQAAAVTAQNIMAGQQIAQGATPYQFSGADFSQFQPTQFAGFSPQQFSATAVSPYAGFQERGVSPFADFQESQATQFQFDPTQLFTGESVGRYMSPYMQQVLDVQKAQAQREFEEQGAGRAAQAVQAGAFGGSRQAVQEAIAERELLNRMADIQATGQQRAFESAQQAFGADRAAEFARQQAQAAELGRAQGIGAQEAARVQEARAAELARTQGISVEEARRIQAGQAGELARVQGLGVQEQARVQQAQAADAARLQAAQAAELARVQGLQVGELGRVQGAGAAEMARVQAAQAAEDAAARQAQLAALGFTGQQAGELVRLGEAQRAGDIQAAQLLETIGEAQMAEQQRGLDVGYQDYLRQLAYPEQQIQFVSSILRGVPIEPSTTQTAYVPTNPLQQALGAGLGAIGLYRGLSA